LPEPCSLKFTGSPGTFDANWIKPNEQSGAKLIYSHSVLLERFVLQPFFEQISAEIYKQMEGKVGVGQGNNYHAARQATATGFNYTISNVTSGDNRYVNNYSVTIQNSASGTALQFKGHLYVYKEVSKSHACAFDDAKASVTATLDWSGNVSITSAKDKAGQPTLTLSKSFQVDHSEVKPWQNDCADALSFFADILGPFLDGLTGFKDKFLFTRLFDSILDLHPNIGNLGVALSNLPDAVQNAVILPAGQVFFFKNVASDAEGNLSLELSYKSES
jgi:hypothetical protein